MYQIKPQQHSTSYPARSGRRRIWCLLAALAVSHAPLLSAEMEEIIVTARMRAESMQDVPVTVSALSAETLDRFQMDKVNEFATRIPTFHILQGGSGSGGSLILRGVGSSPISAAFDSAIAFDIDGIMANTMRLVQNAFMDLQQVEVLKGPQSLYFGKSATAGVLTMKSRDPGDQFEAGVSGSYENEEKGYTTFGFVSGPLSDTFGARFAIQYYDIDEILKVTAPTSTQDSRGEKSLDARLTLKWDVSDKFMAKLKIAYSDWENGGAISNQDIECVDGVAQDTSFQGIYPSGYDCNFADDVIQIGNVNAVNAANWPGLGSGEAFQTQDVTLVSLKAEWELTDELKLTSITGYYNLEEHGVDSYSWDVNGFGVGRTNNQTESWSQELRVESDFSGRFNFMSGAYYQDREIMFATGQTAFGFGNIAPDPVTGRTYDWDKIHTTDAKALSVFGSINIDITDQLRGTVGVRWTDEEKTNVLKTPYVHSFFAALAGIPGVQPLYSGYVSPHINFNDTNVSPEVSLKYTLSDNVMIYGAYKSGFKSGGIDNSALPSNLPADAVKDLIYDSEEVDGFEFGLKSDLLDSSLRVNATVYQYIFDNLQYQEFDAAAIQFKTLNAGELTSQGAEVEAVWQTDIEGLTLYTAIAYLDAEYTASFVTQGHDVKGSPPPAAPEWSGNIGLDFVRGIPASSMEYGISTNLTYSDEYSTNNTANPYIQDSYWLTDATIFIGDTNGRWKISLIGTNIGDEIFTIVSGGRPFAVATDPVRGQDQVHTINHGRLVTLGAKVRF